MDFFGEFFSSSELEFFGSFFGDEGGEVPEDFGVLVFVVGADWLAVGNQE